MITAQGGITKWQRVRISSDGGMVAGKLDIARDVSYPEKSNMDTVMENISRGQRESGKVQSGVSKWTAYANVQDEGPIFYLLSGVASHKEK